MSYVIKRYVEFYSTSMDGERALREVKEVLWRDISTLTIPADVHSFRFFDVLIDTVEENGEQVKLRSDRLNVSPLHYYGGRVEEITTDDGTYKVINLRHGRGHKSFDEGDVFVEERVA